jgi:hypothetical protein
MFQYKVKVYNAVDDKDVEAMGICFGEDFVQAMENLSNHYGEDLLAVVLLVQVGNDNCYELSEEGMSAIDEVRKNFIW